MIKYVLVAAYLGCLLFGATVRADRVYFVNGERFDCTVVGIRDGKLSLRMQKGGGGEAVDLSKVQVIAIDVIPKFVEAENARADPLTAKAAADLYKKLIPTINNGDLRV